MKYCLPLYSRATGLSRGFLPGPGGGPKKHLVPDNEALCLCLHNCIVKEQFELVAQSYRAGNQASFGGSIIAGQQRLIDGGDLLADAIVGSEEGHLFGIQSVVAHQSRADPCTNLDKDIFAGTDCRQLLAWRAIGQHPVEEVGEGHTTRQWLYGVKVGSCQTQRLAKVQQ